MRRCDTKKQKDRNNDTGQKVSGTNYDDSKEQSNGNEAHVSEDQVSRKQVMSFASLDIRMKKTFGSGSVRDRVNTINVVGDEMKCVLGSGRCGTHNTKLVRRVCEKKYSFIDPVIGKLVWRTRDVTSLECPGKTKRTGLAPCNSVLNDQNIGGYNNNKKLRLDKK